MLDKVIELVGNPKTPYHKGVVAYFTKIDDNWGLKFWKNRLARDRNYENQKRAFLVGLGPELGDKFESKLPRGGIIYGFITEYVEPYAESIEYNLIRCVYQRERHVLKLERKLRYELELYDIYVTDLHEWNYGFRKNGGLVPIDFGNDDV